MDFEKKVSKARGRKMLTLAGLLLYSAPLFYQNKSQAQEHEIPYQKKWETHVILDKSVKKNNELYQHLEEELAELTSFCSSALINPSEWDTQNRMPYIQEGGTRINSLYKSIENIGELYPDFKRDQKYQHLERELSKLMLFCSSALINPSEWDTQNRMPYIQDVGTRINSLDESAEIIDESYLDFKIDKQNQHLEEENPSLSNSELPLICQSAVLNPDIRYTTKHNIPYQTNGYTCIADNKWFSEELDKSYGRFLCGDDEYKCSSEEDENGDKPFLGKGMLAACNVPNLPLDSEDISENLRRAIVNLRNVICRFNLLFLHNTPVEIEYYEVHVPGRCKASITWAVPRESDKYEYSPMIKLNPKLGINELDKALHYAWAYAFRQRWVYSYWGCIE